MPDKKKIAYSHHSSGHGLSLKDGPVGSGSAIMKREPMTPYHGFKSDRDRLWALISRDIRIVAVTALCAGAAGFPLALREVVLRWIY